jgi:hypothetical protein
VWGKTAASKHAKEANNPLLRLLASFLLLLVPLVLPLSSLCSYPSELAPLILLFSLALALVNARSCDEHDNGTRATNKQSYENV